VELVGEEPARGQARYRDCSAVELRNSLELLACEAGRWVGDAVVIGKAGRGPTQATDQAEERTSEQTGMT
jgi:hypothetical protein